MNDKTTVIGIDPGYSHAADIYHVAEDGTVTVVDLKTAPPTQDTIAPEEEPAPPSGPRRKAPTYYAGEVIGVGRYNIRINHPDVERWPNGALVGTKHDKLARRRIRARLKERYSSIEAAIKKARQLRLKFVEMADNMKEARRLHDRTLALHQPLPDVDSRALRTAFRERKRALANKRGVHVRELEADVVSELGDKVYGTEE